MALISHRLSVRCHRAVSRRAGCLGFGGACVEERKKRPGKSGRSRQPATTSSDEPAHHDLPTHQRVTGGVIELGDERSLAFVTVTQVVEVRSEAGRVTGGLVGVAESLEHLDGFAVPVLVGAGVQSPLDEPLPWLDHVPRVDRLAQVDELMPA